MGLFDAKATTRLRIGGMTCGHCQSKVEKALRNAPGVTAASVDLAFHKAVVTYDPAKTSPDALAAAVAAIGYTATPQESIG